MFVPNSEMQKQISELHDKAGKVFQETEELRITLNATLQQTLDIQKKMPLWNKGNPIKTLWQQKRN